MEKFYKLTVYKIAVITLYSTCKSHSNTCWHLQLSLNLFSDDDTKVEVLQIFIQRNCKFSHPHSNDIIINFVKPLCQRLIYLLAAEDMLTRDGETCPSGVECYKNKNLKNS